MTIWGVRAAAAVIAATLLLGAPSPADADSVYIDDAESGENAGLAIKGGTFSYGRTVEVLVGYSYLAPDGGFDHYVYVRVGHRTWVATRGEGGDTYFNYYKRRNDPGRAKRCAVTWTIDPANQQVYMSFPTKCLKTHGHRAPMEIRMLYQVLDYQTDGVLYDSLPGGNSVIGEGTVELTPPLHR